MKIAQLFLLSVLSILSMGCEPKSGQTAADEKPVDNTTATPQSAIPEHQRNALEKAKTVEKTLMDAEQKNKDAMNEEGI